MRTLLIDGEWNLRRNFKKRTDMFANGEHCGGSFGFLESLRAIVNKVMPDRVVVLWDGVMSGKFRQELYAPYKANRNKSWDEESYFFMSDEDIDDERRKKYSILQQKIKIKNYLEELCIRHVEVDYIEADDLIALYVKKKSPEEEVFIYSRDKDFHQLISQNVSVIRPSENDVITPENFKSIFGYTLDNALFAKCIEGDDADNIDGIKGITVNTMQKYFPQFMEERYTLDRLIEEAEGLYENKKLKTFEKIIASRQQLELNRTIMNLKRPLVNQEAIDEMDDVMTCLLIDPNNPKERTIDTAMRMMVQDGFQQHVFNNDLGLFFRPFYRIVSKEKEYSEQVLK